MSASASKRTCFEAAGMISLRKTFSPSGESRSVFVNEPLLRTKRATSCLCALFVSLSLDAANAQTAAVHAELAKAFYDFEVAGYCGLVTDDVGNGFRREAKRLISRDAVDADTVTHLRGKAWQAAHAEWQNRGLGGFRNW